MTDRIQQGGLQVATVLHQLLETEIAPGTGIAPVDFWQSLEAIVNDLAPENRALLQVREDLPDPHDVEHERRVGRRRRRGLATRLPAKESHALRPPRQQLDVTCRSTGSWAARVPDRTRSVVTGTRVHPGVRTPA